MKEKLEQIIAQLQADPFSVIKVESIGFGTCVPIINNATNQQLIDKFGGAKEFFESLFNQGIRKIRVIPRKQNGTPKSGAKPNYMASRTLEPFEFEFEPKTTEAQPEEAAQVHQAVVMQEVSLKAPSGLGYAEIHKIVDYPKLERELFETKTELKLVKDDLKKANEKVHEYELFGAKKAEQTEANAKLIGSLSPFQQTINMIAAGLMAKVPGQQPGMNGVAMSPVKEAFMKADDSLLNDLAIVSKGYDIDGFEDKLNVLLKEFNLIQ